MQLDSIFGPCPWVRVIKMVPYEIIVLGCQWKRSGLVSWAELTASFLFLPFTPAWLSTGTCGRTRMVSSLWPQSASPMGNCGRGSFIQLWVILCFWNIFKSQMCGQTRGFNVLRTVHPQKAKNIGKIHNYSSHFNHRIRQYVSGIGRYSFLFPSPLNLSAGMWWRVQRSLRIHCS